LNEAQEKSKEIIEAYHFLVSISPETHHQNFEEYSNIISSSAITNIQYQASILKITYEGGNGFEYFGVPKALYVKLVNADTPGGLPDDIYAALLFIGMLAEWRLRHNISRDEVKRKDEAQQRAFLGSFGLFLSPLC
jgi:hypothetical protein